jgi:hypothetical protein
VRATLLVPDVELWWPVGYGSQPLYSLSATFTPLAVSAEHVSSPLYSVSEERKIGFRTVELITDKFSNQNGSSMYFRVNGVHTYWERGVNVSVEVLLLTLAAVAGSDLRKGRQLCADGLLREQGSRRGPGAARAGRPRCQHEHPQVSPLPPILPRPVSHLSHMRQRAHMLRCYPECGAVASTSRTASISCATRRESWCGKVQYTQSSVNDCEDPNLHTTIRVHVRMRHVPPRRTVPGQYGCRGDTPGTDRA